MANFQDLHPGDRVRFRSYGGLKIASGGKVVPEWEETTGTVQRCLCFEDHVVVAAGNRPYCVDAGNFVNKIERRSKVAA